MGTPSAGLVVFSGGSAANNLVDVFDAVARNRDGPLSYVIPISDNGGSSSELLRVFGGPSVGDVRSRLVRLIPSEPSTPERIAIKAFFNHRLPSAAEPARLEWLSIVESRSPLWASISTSKRELIRSLLLHLNLEILKRTRPPSNTFSFQAAAVGNLFLTGARLFCGSFEAAVYLLGGLTGVPERVQVLPAVNSNFTHHISAGLSNGDVIVGQNSISHPSAPTALPNVTDKEESMVGQMTDDAEEDANLPGSLPTLRQQNIAFSKANGDDNLPARIERIWYINPYGHEMRPPANPRVVEAVRAADCVIYSIGSLYTSIAPCLILRGVGDALAPATTGAGLVRHKILILNGSLDRETGPAATPFSATDFVAAIARACSESRGRVGPPSPAEYRAYVTHVVHLEGEGVPAVDSRELKAVGVETVRLYGRKDGSAKRMRYDGKALAQALEAVMGRRDGKVGPSRRMTIET